MHEARGDDLLPAVGRREPLDPGARVEARRRRAPAVVEEGDEELRLEAPRAGSFSRRERVRFARRDKVCVERAWGGWAA